MTLPTNIDVTYGDDVSDASVKLHQQHHDAIHAFVNGGSLKPGDLDFTAEPGDDGTVNSGDGSAPLLASKMTADSHDRFQIWPDGNMFGGDGSADPSGLANIYPTNSGAGRYGWTVSGELHVQGGGGTGDGNLYIEGVGNGVILKDSTGSPWLVTVGTDGSLGTTAL